MIFFRVFISFSFIDKLDLISQKMAYTKQSVVIQLKHDDVMALAQKARWQNRKIRSDP